jgi:imidazolonepropionase-like amidohydrolase
LAILALTVQSRAPGDSASLVFSHVNVVDVATGSVWSDYSVEVRGARITSVLPASRLKIGPGARVIDARGGFLIPGLWDMHAHVGFFGRDDLAVFLANGVTGVRDLGGVPDTVFRWRREIAAGTLLGPRIEAAGRTLDHGGSTPMPHIASVRTGAEARSAVRANAEAGARAIKMWSNIPQDAFLAAADEARRRNLPLVGHPPIQVGLVEAVEAGQRGIEHTISIPIALSSRRSAILAKLRSRVDGAGELGAIFGALIAADVEALASRDEGTARQVFELLADRKVWVCPTLTDSRAYSVVQDSASTDSRFRYFPGALKAQWVAEGNEGRRHRGTQGSLSGGAPVGRGAASSGRGPAGRDRRGVAVRLPGLRPA